MIEDLLFHVPVRIRNGNRNRIRPIFIVEIGGNFAESFFFLFQLSRIMVAQDVGHIGFFHIPFHGIQMIKALVPFGAGRIFKYRKHSLKLHGNQHRVDHFPLGRTRMHTLSVDMYLCGRSVEIIVLQASNGTAVHRIGKLGTEFFHIEVIHTGANLFIGSKTNFDGAMLYFRMLQQVFHHTDNRSNTCLIVRAQQGRPIGGNQIFPLIHQHFREIFRT